MTASTEDQDSLPVEDQAFEWLLRIREHPDDADLRLSFEAWLFRSPDHLPAWQEICQMWDLMGQSRQYSSKRIAVSSRRARMRVTPRKVGAMVAASVLMICLLLFAVPAVLLRLEADYRTGTSQTSTVRLEDGSTLALGPSSAVATDFSDGRRQVRLLAGEAWFDVARDQERPFHVAAGDVDVQVLGTAFNVRLSDSIAEIGLERGSVKATGDIAGARFERTLVPGEVIGIDRRTGDVSEETVPLDDIGAWRQQRLVVVNETIGSVIAHIRRYHPAWIAIADSELAERRVTGVYNLADLDKALGALVDPYGGKVVKVSSLLRIVTKS